MRFTSLAVVLSFALAGCATSAPEEPAAAEPPSPEELMAMVAELGQPTEPHAELARTAGTWNVAMKSWWEPGGEPMQVDGTSVRTVILGGRFVREDMTFDMMGQRVQGLLLLGHDNFTEEHVAVWLDSMSSGVAVMRGQQDETGAVRLSGVMKDPFSPEGRPYRSVTRQVDANEMHFEMFDTLPDGSESKTMEARYTRK